MLDAIFEFDKALTVAKLRGARERKRRDMGECEGRKSHAERNPELAGTRPGRNSVRAIFRDGQHGLRRCSIKSVRAFSRLAAWMETSAGRTAAITPPALYNAA